MDLQGSLFDPIYSVQGVTATVILTDGTVLLGATVLDKSFGQVLSRKARRHSGFKRSKGTISTLQLSSSRPYAIIRNSDVVKFGKVAGDLVNQFVQFNGTTYRVDSYLYRPTTNGIDDGEVMLILSSAGVELPAVMLIGQSDGDSDAIAKLAFWLSGQGISQSTASSILAAFIRGEAAGESDLAGILGAWLEGDAQCLSDLFGTLAAFLRGEVAGESDLFGTLAAFLRGEVVSDSELSSILSAYLRGEVVGDSNLTGILGAWLDGQTDCEGSLAGRLPAWLVGEVAGQSTADGTIITSDPKARIIVAGTERMTADGQTRVTI